MPKIKATAGGVDIPDGTFTATLLNIEEATPGPNAKADKPFFRWTFHVYDGSKEGVQMTANSSMSCTPKSKMRGWVEALMGRALALGEEFELCDILPKDCLVAIKRNDNGYADIEKVLSLPKPKPGTAVVPPQTALPTQKDGIEV